jgi:hypothetical protein
MQAKPQSASLGIRLLAAALLFSVNLSATQQAAQSGSQPAQSQSQPGGVMIDPSAGPLKPSEPPPSGTQPSEVPSVQPPVTSTPEQPPQSSQTSGQPAAQAPVGAAAAEQVRTAGGAASRPAGNAIAPVKQHQYRSILIKLGAIAAAGIAAGTVYGLSRATPSTPPHATTAATK